MVTGLASFNAINCKTGQEIMIKFMTVQAKIYGIERRPKAGTEAQKFWHLVHGSTDWRVVKERSGLARLEFLTRKDRDSRLKYLREHDILGFEFRPCEWDRT